MKQNEGFDFEVSARLSLDKEDIEIFIELSATHYDGRCQELSTPLNGMMNEGMNCGFPVNRSLDFRTIDTMAKTMGSANYAGYTRAKLDRATTIMMTLGKVLRSINEIWNKIRDVA